MNLSPLSTCWVLFAVWLGMTTMKKSWMSSTTALVISLLALGERETTWVFPFWLQEGLPASGTKVSTSGSKTPLPSASRQSWTPELLPLERGRKSVVTQPLTLLKLTVTLLRITSEAPLFAKSSPMIADIALS